jgi:hypothetical protein
VEIKVETLEEEEDEIFDLEINDHATEMATKLDALMDIMFLFLANQCERYASRN